MKLHSYSDAALIYALEILETRSAGQLTGDEPSQIRKIRAEIRYRAERNRDITLTESFC